MKRYKFERFLLPFLTKKVRQFFQSVAFIRLLSLIIVFLPLTEVFLVTRHTFFPPVNNWRTITIDAGDHSYYPAVQFVYDLDEIEFYFRTDSSWFYPEPERNGWSKLRGFSKGFHHNGSSARLVYRCEKDTLLLVGSYCYVNGVHPNDTTNQQAVLDTIYPGQVYHCIIRHNNGKFKFYFENTYWECPSGECPSWGYMLNPFIGGVFTLDHDWNIGLLDVRKESNSAIDFR